MTAHDARDPGVDSRVLVPSNVRDIVDGHGGVTRDAEALRLLLATIESRAAPADRRGAEVKAAADRQSDAAGAAALAAALAALLIAVSISAILSCAPYIRLVTRPLALMQLRAVRRR